MISYNWIIRYENGAGRELNEVCGKNQGSIMHYRKTWPFSYLLK